MLLNLAGVSTGDPTLKNLAVEFVFASSSMDVAALTNAWIDQAAGFPGTNSILASLSPASTVFISGAAGSYNDTSKELTIASTTGLSAGDYLYLSHASITAGVYKIAAIVSAGVVTFVSNPFNGLGNKTGVAYQNGWRYTATLGSAPLVSSAGGQINYFKVEATDAIGNIVQAVDQTYIEDPPSGTAYIAISGKTYDGTQTINALANSFNLLAAWTNKGGVSHIGIANHSGQGVNNFTWTSGGGTAEKTTAAAISSGLTVTAGDGMKYGRLLLRDLSGSGNTAGVDIAINLDTTAPTITMYLFGR